MHLGVGVGVAERLAQRAAAVPLSSSAVVSTTSWAAYAGRAAGGAASASAAAASSEHTSRGPARQGGAAGRAGRLLRGVRSVSVHRRPPLRPAGTVGRPAVGMQAGAARPGPGVAAVRAATLKLRTPAAPSWSGKLLSSVQLVLSSALRRADRPASPTDGGGSVGAGRRTALAAAYRAARRVRSDRHYRGLEEERRAAWQARAKDQLRPAPAGHAGRGRAAGEPVDRGAGGVPRRAAARGGRSRAGARADRVRSAAAAPG